MVADVQLVDGVSGTEEMSEEEALSFITLYIPLVGSMEDFHNM